MHASFIGERIKKRLELGVKSAQVASLQERPCCTLSYDTHTRNCVNLSMYWTECTCQQTASAWAEETVMNQLSAAQRRQHLTRARTDWIISRLSACVQTHMHQNAAQLRHSNNVSSPIAFMKMMLMHQWDCTWWRAFDFKRLWKIQIVTKVKSLMFIISSHSMLSGIIYEQELKNGIKKKKAFGQLVNPKILFSCINIARSVFLFDPFFLLVV